MSKLLLGLVLVVSLVVFTGCGEKSDEQKAKDAATKLQEDAEKKAGEILKKTDKATDDAAKKLDDMTGK